MKETDLLKRLAATANKEPAPETDIVDRVLAALDRDDEDVIRPLAWVAGLSLAAAVPMVVMAVQAIDIFTDPLQGALSAVGWTLL